MNRDETIASSSPATASSPVPSSHSPRMPASAATYGSRGARPAVLMDAPPPEDVRPFLRIAAHLRTIGVPVPRIFAADETSGLVLEEDFGDDLLSVLLDHNEPPDPLLDAAVDALVIMQRAPPPEGLPAWDATTMATTAAATLFDWWWPAKYAAPAPEPPATTSPRHSRQCWNRFPAAHLLCPSRLLRRQPAAAADHRCRRHRLPERRRRPPSL